MSNWFDERARQSSRHLTSGQRRKIREIRQALAASDRAVHDHASGLDVFEGSARAKQSGYVGPPWTDTLAKLRTELLHARDRLDKLHTGLRAQDLLRTSLIQGAAAIAAWQFALESSDVNEIVAARRRMRDHFLKAEQAGTLGAKYLKDGH